MSKDIEERFDLKEYTTFFVDIKNRIMSAQVKAAVTVNKELLSLYWDLGNKIIKKQTESKWGDSIVDILSKDLRNEFPANSGFSRANLFNIRKWYLFYANASEKIQQAVRQIPWGHNILIISRLKTLDEASFYVFKVIENNWSRNVLLHQIETELYNRQGKITNNFEVTLPKLNSDLAKETLKDPYVFDFLFLSEQIQEKDLQTGLIRHITKFLLELGSGFSFVGSEYPVEISGKEYRIDLLFYHLKLKCYIVIPRPGSFPVSIYVKESRSLLEHVREDVSSRHTHPTSSDQKSEIGITYLDEYIELKIGEFKPEHAGKINFYLSAVDETIKDKTDNPSIGIILCKTKDRVIAEYALKDLRKPIGIAEYKLIKTIPKEIEPVLPTVEDLEWELNKRE